MLYRFPRRAASSCLNRRLGLPISRRLITVTALTALMAFAVPAKAGSPGDRPLQFTARSDTIDLSGLEQSFRQVAQRVSPAVVAITASSDPAAADQPLRSADLNGSMLDRLMQGSARIVGTGFCVDAEGYILTNEHVVRDAKQIYVTTDDGRTFPALVVGTDPRSDLAMLKIPAALPAVTFAAGNEVSRGQWTIVLGNPVGLAATGSMCMSVGIISAVGRELPRLSEREGRIYSNLIQTSAEVNPGNSGGPLIDLQGNIIGMVTAVVLPHKTTNGVGFAIPADTTLKARIAQLKRGSPILYGYLGVAVTDHAGGGVWVNRVGESAPAAGVLKPGDILVSVDGRAVPTESAFVRIVGASPTDRPVKLRVKRNGRDQTFSVRLISHPNVKPGVDASNQRFYWRGAELGIVAQGGVRICNLFPGSPLASAGAKPGSVIEAVAGKPVPDLVSLLKVLDETPAELCQVQLAPQQVSETTTIASGAE